MTRPTRTYMVYGFRSTHEALDAEALLDDLGVEVTPIPAPVTVSAVCGIALRVDLTDAPKADRYLLNAGLEPLAALEIEDI